MTQPVKIRGIHHVTGVCSDAQRNLDFYAGVLGLRLVKLTVNVDHPSTHHLYYGDETGRPGTVVSFIVRPDGYKGTPGIGQVAAISLTIPPTGYEFWIARLTAHGIRPEGPVTVPPASDDRSLLSFRDPDGLPVELVVEPVADTWPSWSSGPIPAQYAIRGLYGATFWEGGYEGTARLLTQTLGFRQSREEGGRASFAADGGGPGTLVDIHAIPDVWHGTAGVGTIHHIAFRVADHAALHGVHRALIAAHTNPTPVLDRGYFHSVYAREPGGVLFEIATDGPGFTVDENVSELGTHLKLPPRLEPRRQEIERLLPPLHLPWQR